MKDLTLKEEQVYLKRVNLKISQELGIRNKQLDFDTESLEELQKDMWEVMGGFGFERDPIEFAQNLEMLRRQALLKDITGRRAETLIKMLKNAFFGRIDFHRDRDDMHLPIYIGLSTISDKWEFLVYDWRAPICSLFYESEIGRVKYKAPIGIVTGELKRRIQYDIEDGELKGFFDTELKVDDEILKSILSKSTDGQIKNIVQSIQKKQNAAIRDETHKFLAVFGPAGCGKTTVAMHRAAWLLYNSRDSMTASNIVFISPNMLFTDYLSSILPELGEDNISFTTVFKLERKYLKNYHIEKRHSHFEYMLSSKNTINGQKLRKRLAIKNSYEFFSELQSALDSYMGCFTKNIKDLTIREMRVCTKKELIDMMNTSKKIMDFGRRINRTKNYCIEKFQPIKEGFKSNRRFELESADRFYSKSDIDSMINDELIELEKEMHEEITTSLGLSIAKVYLNFLKSYKSSIDLVRSFKDNLSAQRIGQEDAAALLFSHTYIYGEKQKDIKHLLLDETQDYGYLYIAAFRLLYPNAAITMLGDANQAIYSGQSMSSLRDVSQKLFGSKLATVQLTTSYRSSYEITKLCNRIAKSENEILPYNRHNNEPRIIKLKNKQDIIKRIKIIVKEYKKTYKSIGIIARSMSTCTAIKSQLNINMLSSSSEIFPEGVCILPSYISKGLEFDCVIVVSFKDDHFDGEDERNLFYTVCSRALHELTILTTSDICFLSKGGNENEKN